MNLQDKKEFKEIVKDGAVEALRSEASREVIKEGAIAALKSKGGQQAIVGALQSEDGKQAIVGALKTPEAKEVFLDNFRDAFHDVVAPVFEEQEKRIKKIEGKLALISS